jgi:hypothetical protein
MERLKGNIELKLLNNRLTIRPFSSELKLKRNPVLSGNSSGTMIAKSRLSQRENLRLTSRPQTCHSSSQRLDALSNKKIGFCTLDSCDDIKLRDTYKLNTPMGFAQPFLLSSKKSRVPRYFANANEVPVSLVVCRRIYHKRPAVKEKVKKHHNPIL